MKINRNNHDFYKIMGPVFGSRLIQRKTNDRFYDDPDKEWLIEQSSDGVDYVISIKGSVIKNIYVENTIKASEALKAIYPNIATGIVPSCYSEVYTDAGYTLLDSSKKFVTIKGGYHGRD